MTTTTTELPDDLMTTREAARYFGVDLPAVRWYVRECDPPLKPYKTVGRSYLFRRVDVMAYERPPLAGWGRSRQPYPREPFRYGQRYRHIPRTVRVAPRDLLADDVAALIVAHTEGRRDLAATVRAVIKRVRAEPQKG